MEDEETGDDLGKKSFSKNSHLSISDIDSTISPIDSPPRSEEPSSVNDPHYLIEEDDFEIERNNSPIRKPNNPMNPYTEPEGRQPIFGLNKIVRERTKPEVKTVEPAARGGIEERKASTLRRSERGGAVRVAFILRILEAVSCLISFTVMASDRTQGWNGDSFVRHKEYRYCLAINVFGFIYSGFQAYNVAYNLSTGRQWMSHNLFYYLEFSMDQLLAYLLMSASSSAATRVDDWITNWGNDKFTMMASASIGMSFLGFVAFSLSSLISGYILCNRDSGLWL